MFELVPSEYMREIFREEGFELTDFQKATLIWNAPDKNRNAKLTALKELLENTDDVRLQRQIIERIQYEEKAFCRFKDNSAGRYVYVIVDEYGYSCGFFVEYDMARDYLLKYIKEYEAPCKLEKQVLVKDVRDLIVRKYDCVNPNLRSETTDKKGEEHESYEGFATSCMSFDGEGSIKGLRTGEMSGEEEKVVGEFMPDRFENHFFKIPFWGWQGAPVRDMTDHEWLDDYRAYGVLVDDAKSWENYLHRIEQKNLFVDFYDMNVKVYFLNEQGVWMHEHINPIYLEVGVYPRNFDNEKVKAYVYAMEAFCDYWANGKERYDDVYAKRAIKMAKEYRDICLEYYAGEQKRRCKLVDRAETIYDIMS